MAPETSRQKELERHPYAILLEDPLGEESRRNRRALLVLSLICILARLTGTLPTEWSGLGLKFSADHRLWMIRVALATDVYLLLVFSLSGAADFFRWRRKLRHGAEVYVKEHGSVSKELEVKDAIGVVPVGIWPFGGRLGAAFYRVQTFVSVRVPHGWEADDVRIKLAMRDWLASRCRLPSALWKIYPTVLIHQILIFGLPVALSLAAGVGLWTWKIATH